MKKKLLLLAVVLLIAALTACMLAACNGDDGTPGADDPAAEPPGDQGGTDDPGTGDGTDDAYIDRTVLAAFTARINETLTSEASERSERWRAYAYSVDIAADPEFLENAGYGTESEGIVAWGVVGEKSDEDTGTGGHAEYAWSDDTVFWVAYESADMAEERGLDDFGIGATNATMFRPPHISKDSHSPSSATALSRRARRTSLRIF